jgi:polyisoprenoid-binding protein YceI
MAGAGHIAEAMTSCYVVDAAKSRFQVKAFASGLLASLGHNPTIAIRKFTGEVRFREEAPEQSSLHIAIDADALTVTGNVSDKDRTEMERMMKQEVLETDRFSDIRFEGAGRAADKLADGMYRVTLGGRLALHGEEREIEFPCNVIVSPDTLRANGDFTIRQTDYRIKLVSVAGGSLKLKDELKFTFDIVAARSGSISCA